MEIEQASDPELLKKWAGQQCEASFREIVRRHARLVHGAALRGANDPHIAAEAAQLTFIALANKAGSLAGHPELMGWLHLTSVRHTRNLTRKRSREKLKIETLEAQMAATPDEPCREWEEMRPLLDDALSRMRGKEREIILLRYLGDLSVRDIGSRLGISVEAAQKRLNRAMVQLRALLAKRGYQGQARLGTVLAAGIISEAILPPAFAAELGSRAITAAKATAAAAPLTATLLTYLIMKKSTVAALALLIAAGIATVSVIRNRHPSPALGVNPEPPTAAVRVPGGSSTDRRFATNPRNGRSDRAKQSELKTSRLEQEYGVSRTTLSHKVGQEILKIFGQLTEVEEILLEGNPPLFEGKSENLFRDPRIEALGLDATQKERIFRKFLAIRRKKAEEHRNFKAAMLADPGMVMEQLLIEDAVARRTITPQEAKERQTPECAAAGEMLSKLWEESGLDSEEPLFDPGFRNALQGILTAEQYEQLVKSAESTDRVDSALDDAGTPADVVSDASDDFQRLDAPFSAEDAMTLEDQEKAYSSMNLLLKGMKGLLKAESLMPDEP
jgi:RNA polymerase sigma factor (sigma-70 family)